MLAEPRKGVSLVAREIESERNFAWNVSTEHDPLVLWPSYGDPIPILATPPPVSGTIRRSFIAATCHFKTKTASVTAVKKSGYGRKLHKILERQFFLSSLLFPFFSCVCRDFTIHLRKRD